MVIATRRTRRTPLKTEDPSRLKGAAENVNPEWGRQSEVSLITVVLSFLVMACCPVLVIYYWIACDSYQCSLWEPLRLIKNNSWSMQAVNSVLIDRLPTPSTFGFQIFAAWLLFQGILYAFLPATIATGQRTPAGYLLQYKVNGLRAWFVSHALFIGLSWGLGLFKPSIIYDNWGPLLVAANVYGYFLTAFAYFKALWFPTHAEDRKFSGSIIYDIFMGVEFNPRFGKLWDYKLFHNGRPGIVAWTMIDLSMAAAQYQLHGHVTNSMLLVLWLHAVYVVDFFYNENWYLRTIDIAHDHFGFYLAWGDSVWLPFMYTLQAVYLVHNPVNLPAWAAAAVFAFGMFGYYIFRSVNDQKDLVRLTDGKCLIWGKPPRLIRTKYRTSDGKEHSSILLASGWWGFARHFNYTGDLILSFCMCAACGLDHLFPWFYFFYMLILLVQRIRRDDARCTGKYGKYWEEYKKVVPYSLIPYVY